MKQINLPWNKKFLFSKRERWEHRERAFFNENLRRPVDLLWSTHRDQLWWWTRRRWRRLYGTSHFDLQGWRAQKIRYVYGTLPVCIPNHPLMTFFWEGDTGDPKFHLRSAMGHWWDFDYDASIILFWLNCHNSPQMKVILCDCPIHDDFAASFVSVRFFYLTQNQSPEIRFS